MLKRNKILLLCSLVLIFSLTISMSALAFEVDFDGSAEKEKGKYETVVTAVQTADPASTSSYWNTEVYWDTAVQSPSMTGVAPIVTGIRPEYPESTYYPEKEWTDNKETVGKDEQTKPEVREPITLEGANDVYRGNGFGYSIYVNDPIAVKSGAVSISFDSDVFELTYIGWYLSTAPVIATTNDNQKNGAFAYAEPTNIEGEIFYFSLYVKDFASYGTESIRVDITLMDENQNAIEIKDPEISVYIGCENHYFDTAIYPEALAKPATCQSYAEYYKSCGNCWKMSNETFTDYGSGYADHSIRDEWLADGETHWHGCDNCHTMDSDMGKHTFGKWTVIKEATKEEDGIRECSCTVCGYTKAENVKYKSSSTNKGNSDDDDEPEVMTTAEATTAAAQSNTTININGCGSSIALGAVAVLPVLACGALIVKKKED